MVHNDGEEYFDCTVKFFFLPQKHFKNPHTKTELPCRQIQQMIFVTGGTGFLGTHLLRELINRGEKVRAIKRSTSKIFLEKKFADAIEWIDCDVLDVAGLQQAMHGCTHVYHCAAIVRFTPAWRNQIMKVNAKGTANVVNVALSVGVKKIIYASSVAAIGRNRNNELVNEKTEWQDGKNNSNYGISKHLAENEIWRGIAEGLQAVIVNPSLILGEGNWDDGPPEFFKRIRNGLRFYTDGGSGMVAVSDVVNIMIALMESEINNERFILNAENISFKELFFSIADLINAKRPSTNVGKKMMEFLWRFEMLKYRLIGISPLVTKETARFASNWSRFDNQKIVNAIRYQFTPIKKCLEETAVKFLEDERKGRDLISI